MVSPPHILTKNVREPGDRVASNSVGIWNFYPHGGSGAWWLCLRWKREGPLTDGGSEVWHYEYAHATANGASYVPIVGLFAGGAHVNKNELVFIFDKNDVMQNYTVHASESDVRRGGANLDSK